MAGCCCGPGGPTTGSATGAGALAATAADRAAAEARVRRASFGRWLRLGLGIVVAGNSMVLSLAVNFSVLGPAERLRLHAIAAGLAGIVLALLGPPLVRDAWRGVRRGRLPFELMFLLGIAGALGTSAWGMATGGSAYWETAAVLVVIHALGRELGRLGRTRAAASLAEWVELGRSCVRLGERDDGGGGAGSAGSAGSGGRREERVPIAEIRAGDRLRIGPGEIVPVDGRVAAGRAFVAEAEVTGEPLAVVRGPGDRLVAGTRPVDGPLEVEAAVAGGDGSIGRLGELLDAARRRPARIEQQVDRVTRWFLPAVATIAIGAAVGWTIADGPARGIFTGLAVLLIACPCAMGFATPIAIWATVGRLAERGLVATRGEAIEALAGIDTVVLDKTGTLTDDRAELRAFVPRDDDPAERARIERLVATAEAGSDHPVAAALAGLGAGGTGSSSSPAVAPAVATAVGADAGDVAVPGRPRLAALRTLPGTGIEADVVEHEPDGTERTAVVRIGVPAAIVPAADRAAWDELRRRSPLAGGDTGDTGDTGDAGDAGDVKDASRTGGGGGCGCEGSGGGARTGEVRDERGIAVVIDGRLAAAAFLDERWRPSADDAIAACRTLGLRTVVMTGDPAGATRPLAVDRVHAGLSPADKLAEVMALRDAGRTVLFVGDGVNDAAAMEAAHAAIAVVPEAADGGAGGSDRLVARIADLVTTAADLGAVPGAVAAARTARGRLRSNLAMSAVYNVLGITVAAAGFLHPLLAALIMTVSSLTVSLRAMSLAPSDHAAPPRPADGGADAARVRPGPASSPASARATSPPLATG